MLNVSLTFYCFLKLFYIGITILLSFILHQLKILQLRFNSDCVCFFFRRYVQPFPYLRLFLWENYSFSTSFLSERWAIRCYSYSCFFSWPNGTCSKCCVAKSEVDSVIMAFLLPFLQGITTYEYVVAMRTQSEPPGPSVDGGDHQSLPSSPTGSAVTAMSGRSSVGMGLQYKGAWCTPPRIFMDHQVTTILHSIPNFDSSWCTLPRHCWFLVKKRICCLFVF